MSNFMQKSSGVRSAYRSRPIFVEKQTYSLARFSMKIMFSPKVLHVPKRRFMTLMTRFLGCAGSFFSACGLAWSSPMPSTMNCSFNAVCAKSVWDGGNFKIND